MKYITRALGTALLATLPTMAMSASPGFLIYRVYLPSSSPQEVKLPTLTLRYSDGRPSKTLAPCAKPVKGLIQDILTQTSSRCAWPLIVAGENGLNVAYPDTGATYWVAPFTVDPALTIQVDGVFPDARYMSFNTYDGTGSSFELNGMKSALADYLIKPKPGSKNPWQTSAPAGGNFTVVVRPDAAPGMPNVLPMPPETAPQLSKLIGMGQVCSNAPCPDTYAFEPYGKTGGGMFPNVHNDYVSARQEVTWKDVVVVRGKLPRTPAGASSTHPVVWPNPDIDVRYWSICNNWSIAPFMVEDCLFDHQMVTDEEGYYTFVTSSKLSRPSNATADHGVSWLEISTLLPAIRKQIIVRNMLPHDFAEAIQNVPDKGGEQAARDVMKAYYPEVWKCTKTVFEAGGWRACAAASKLTR